jgi:ferritin
MALHKNVEAVLNQQLEKEFDAQAVYLGMSIHFEKDLFKGFAAWFRKQTAEEQTHAAKIIQYMLDRGANPVVPAVAAPKVTYDTTLEAFKAALTHERANTAGIYKCLAIAQKADDPATVEMLQWFVKEQVEEEQWAEEYTQMVERIAGSIGGIYQFDHRVEKAAKRE